jgi:hypothetical protein
MISSYHDFEFNQLASAQLFPPFDQMPLLIQASSSDGFASYHCAGSGLQTPVPTFLTFQASSPYISPSSSIFGDGGVITPPTGSFVVYDSSRIPTLVGQISSGQITGNAFTFRGALSNIDSGTSSFCTSSFFQFPISNSFTITGICGTNVPLAFAVDLNVIGAYTANVACNNAVL